MGSRMRGDDRVGGVTTVGSGENDAKATVYSGEGKPKIEVGVESTWPGTRYDALNTSRSESYTEIKVKRRFLG